MRWLIACLGVAILLGVAAFVVTTSEGDRSPSAGSSSLGASLAPSVSSMPEEDEFTDPCGTFDTGMGAPYAITGYWLVPTVDHCTWRRQFSAIHRVGGDTVIRIGWGLQARRLDDDGRILDGEGEVDSRYEPCEEDGVPCVAAAENDLKAANPGNRVSWTFVYRTDEAFGPDLFRCPEFERKIVTKKTVFYRIVATDDGTDDGNCGNVRSKGRGYHVILVAGAHEDSLTELLDLGDQFGGVKVFPALPLAPRDPAQKTRAAKQGTDTLTTLTRRIMQDYGVRFRDRTSLGGFYQPFELQMREMKYTGDSDDDHPTLKMYASQHQIVEQEMPGRPVLVSPYLDARKEKPFSATPQQVARGFEALVRTGVGIIAPQDSRGTGKVGLFWPDQRGDRVDERLWPAVGEKTNGDAYHGSTRDYYREMSTTRTALAGQGFNVQLWANVEAFEPSGEERCAASSDRGRTDKERLDTAVAQVGRYVSKVVSYMWSDFYTCGTPSLSEEIARDWDRPIAADAVRVRRDIQDGVEIRGYNMPMGSKVTITWEGQEEPRVIEVAGVNLNDPPPDLPTRMETAWIPFDWSQVPDDTWIKLSVAAADGRSATEPLRVRVRL